MQEYEEIVSLYMEKSMEDLESKTKESLPELLAQIYFYTKEVIAAETGVDVLKTSSFLDIMIIMIIIIIITRPKPAYGRQGLAGSWGQDTDEVRTFLVFLTFHCGAQLGFKPTWDH